MNKIELSVNVKGNRIWLPRDVQSRITNIFIRVHIERLSFITKINKDGRLVIPKEILFGLNIINNSHHNVKIEILQSLDKPENFLKDGYVDLLFFVSRKTLSGFDVLVLEEANNKLRLWYSTKGRPNEIVINRFVSFKFVRLLGYYQAEGGKLKLTKRRGRELNFTNTSLDIIQDFINLSKDLINITEWKASIRYKENTKETEIASLVKILNDFGVNNVYTHSAKIIDKCSVRLWITSSLIVELVYNCMNSIRKYLANGEPNQLNLTLASYFLQGVIAGDGNIYCVKGKKHSLHPRLSIFESNEECIKDYYKLLMKFGIIGNYVKRKGKNLFIYSGYINKHNLQSVLSNRLLDCSKNNYERLLKAKLCPV